MSLGFLVHQRLARLNQIQILPQQLNSFIPNNKQMTEHLYKESKTNPLFQGNLYTPLKDIKQKNELLKSIRTVGGFSKQHIESFNEFINIRLDQIVKANDTVHIETDENFYLKYEGIRVGKPTYVTNYDKYNKVNKMFPHECRISDLSYSANILVDIRYSIDGVVERKTDVNIGRMPIMLGSSHCWLQGKSTSELAMLKECPYDPRGYFIIGGSEKVLLIQEQMIENRIIVEKNAKQDTIIAGVVSYTLDTKSVCGVLFKDGKLYLKSSSFQQIIPIFVIFKALGIESEQQVFQLINPDTEMLEILVLSLQDCQQKGVYTTKEAKDYLGKKLAAKKFQDKRQKNTLDQVHNILCNILLSHIKIVNFDLYPKATFLSLMVKRLIEGIRDPSKLDNRDYYGNKRMKLAGNLMELLFQDRFKEFNTEIRKELNKMLSKNQREKKDLKVILEGRQDIISHRIEKAISTGNWTIKRFNMDRKGVSQLLSRISYISALGMMTRLTSQFEKTRKIAGPRALLGSHWGMICPCDTPDGQGCGLVKNLALNTCVTTTSPPIKISSLAIQDYAIFNKGHRVTINGSIVGYTLYTDLIDRIKLMRRKGIIDKNVNVALIKSYNQEYGEIIINMDYGRLVRPLIIVEKGIPLLTKTIVEAVYEKRMTFDDVLKTGCIEFLDVTEEENSLIALTPMDLTVEHTHLEIDPLTIIGCVAGLIPYPHHNQSPRNIYQCSMGKQAQGIIGLNQLVRFDTLNYLLVYPQKPLVKTTHIDLINYENLPAGHNASVAVMSYSGYDIEDAVMINKASLDRGFGRSMYYRRYETDLQKYGDVVADILVPPDISQRERETTDKKRDKQHRKYQALDRDGLARIGAKLQAGDIYVNKKMPIIPPGALSRGDIYGLNPAELSYSDHPIYHKGNKDLIVDKTVLTSNDKSHVLIKTVLREMRRPELGDKFSSRHGQKGVCGLIIPEEDMPFSETGWKPDLIMNPHGYPSRMTVGKLLELVGGKAGALQGKQNYGTAFGGQKLSDYERVLIENGFECTGKDVLFSGITGEYLDCYVFCGPIFYQRLKHMVADKIHARAKGKVSILTRQPTEGRAKEGGLRLGQMERDCLLGFGASDLLLQRLLISSDQSHILVCEKCGLFKHLNYCQSCKTKEVFKISIPYACKLLFQQLLSMGIKPKINLSKVTSSVFDKK